MLSSYIIFYIVIYFEREKKKVLTIYLGSYDPFSDFDEKLNQEVGTLKQELGVTELGTYNISLNHAFSFELVRFRNTLFNINIFYCTN